VFLEGKKIAKYRGIFFKKIITFNSIQCIHFMPQMHAWFLEIAQYFIFKMYSQRLLVEAFDMRKKIKIKIKIKIKPCLHVVITRITSKMY
jgi:hypothetical protein